MVQNKKARYEFVDSTSVNHSLVTTFGKFELFKQNPEVYLSNLNNYLCDNHPNFNMNDLVNCFFSLLDKSLQEWYFSFIYKNGLVFDEFKTIFVDSMHVKMYDNIQSISLSLEDYLDDKKVTGLPRYNEYFKSKCDLLSRVFKLDEYHSRLFSICFLSFKDYSVFFPVLKDSVAFDALVKVKDTEDSAAQIPDFFLEDQRLDAKDVQDGQDRDALKQKIAKLEQSVDTLEKERDDLQTINNQLTDSNIKLENDNAKLKDDTLAMSKRIKELLAKIGELN